MDKLDVTSLNLSQTTLTYNTFLPISDKRLKYANQYIMDDLVMTQTNDALVSGNWI